MKQPKEWECSNCGAPATVARGEYQFTESGLNVLLIGVELIKCRKCGNKDPIIPDMADLMRCIALAVVEKPWNLSGAEVRYLRKYLKMTAAEFSGHMAVDSTTVSKWENDKAKVGPTADRYIRALALLHGEGLKDSTEDVSRKFPEIKKALRDCEYRYHAETRQMEVGRALSRANVSREKTQCTRVDSGESQPANLNSNRDVLFGREEWYENLWKLKLLVDAAKKKNHR
jgi:DNA-binding transcriptional regulator YiaG